MIINCMGVNYCINCDWLQFSATKDPYDPSVICPQGFRMECLPGNNIFKDRSIIYDSDGQRVVTCLWNPYSRVIKSNIVTCQIDNRILYSAGIHLAYRIFSEAYSASFNSMGRVDICCDFEVNATLLSVIRKLWDGSYYCSRKKEGSCFWHCDSSVAGRWVHCMSWGSKSSEIKVKLYNKSRELGVNDNGIGEKQYIINEWINAGFDVRYVWRLEFSLCSSGQLRFDGKSITLDDITNSNWLVSTFVSLYNTRFEVRENLGRINGHHNNDPIVTFLQLNADEIEIKWQDPKEDALPSDAKISLLRKLMVQFQESKAVAANDEVFAIMADTIIRLCDDRKLYGYFCRIYGANPLDYCQNAFQSSGEGLKQCEPSPRLYD